MGSSSTALVRDSREISIDGSGSGSDLEDLSPNPR